MIHVIIVKPLEIKLLFVTHCLSLIHSFIHSFLSRVRIVTGNGVSVRGTRAEVFQQKPISERVIVSDVMKG